MSYSAYNLCMVVSVWSSSLFHLKRRYHWPNCFFKEREKSAVIALNNLKLRISVVFGRNEKRHEEYDACLYFFTFFHWLSLMFLPVLYRNVLGSKHLCRHVGVKLRINLIYEVNSCLKMMLHSAAQSMLNICHKQEAM